jgi:CheY-like chemotaxis protein
LNLAVNARHAMPRGGKLGIKTRNTSLTAAEPPDMPAGDYVQVSVTDTGEGMSKEIQARAFDPFFTTKEVGKGTGLGLSQVYGFAKQVHGTVRIDSTIGEGTTVTMELPRAQAAALHEELSPNDLAPEGPLKILLVDDDEAVRSLMEQMLGELGHSVSTAENGPAAVVLLSANAPFDLLVVDFAMPVMNGAEVAAEAVKLRPKLSILFVTGFADRSILSTWTALGYRTLKKPFSGADFDAAIRQTVASRPDSRT